MGGCRLCRPSGRMVTEVGKWQLVDVGGLEDEVSFAVLPTAIGTLQKAKD